MEYSYRLLNPRDYLRLLYCVCFNMQALPAPTQREEQITLVLQALVLSVAGNFFWGGAANWWWGQFAWERMIYGCAIGLCVGLLLGTLTAIVAPVGDKSSEAVEMGVRFGLPASLALGVSSGLTDPVLAGLASGAVLSRTVSSRLSGIAGAFLGAIASLAGGVAGSVSVGMADRLGYASDHAGYLLGIGVNGLIWAVGVTIAAGVAVRVEKFNRVGSVWVDCWGGVGLLLLLSFGVWGALGWLRFWLDEIPAPPNQLTVVGVIGLCYCRLPLWPLEAAVGVLWRLWQSRKQLSPDQLVNAIRWAYFDCHMILPLPGETAALERLHRLDHDRAVREAIELARFSGHSLAAVSTLRILAHTDPLGVQAHIGAIPDERDRKRLLRYVVYRLPEAPARAWKAQQQVEEINANLQAALSPGASKPEEEKAPRQIFRPRSHAQSATELVPDSSRREAIDRERGKLAQVVKDFKDDHKHRMLHVGAFGAIYSALLEALESETIADLGNFSIPALSEGAPHLISPSLRQILVGLNQLAATAQGYATTTSPVTQRDVLLQANEQLEAIAAQVQEHSEALGAFGPLLVLLVTDWRQLLTSVGGGLARKEQVRPVSNPYVYGNPVLGRLFVGREDVMRHLQAEWGHDGQCSSVIIYGHRRMGKSSILQNLGVGDRFGDRTIIVDFNMQRVGHVKSTGELLLYLALKLRDVCVARGLKGVGELREDDFFRLSPYVTFDRFLFRLDRARQDHRFIITVDEFEIIEKQIKEGRLEAQLLEHWRGAFTTYHWFIMAFAGLHTLEEMRHDFWSPLFACVHAIEVDFLSREAAEQLITKPSPDFAMDYTPQAVGRIAALTGGQPYLIQLICHTLVLRFNKQVFEESQKRERCFTETDVEAVIETPEFKRESSAYFNGVWEQAEESREQTAILKALSRRNLSFSSIVMETGLRQGMVEGGLDILRRRKVIRQRHGKYGYTVPLMCDWVARKKK